MSPSGFFSTFLSSMTLAGALSVGGCASTPDVVPAGRESGGFFDEPTSTPRFSATMNARRQKLNQAVQQELQVQFEVLRDLTESSREFRNQIQKRQAALIERFETNDEISPLDAELVLEAAHWFIELDAMLFDLWASYRRYLPNGSEPDPYAPYRAATLLDPAVRAKGGLIALTAEMVRMDNAALVVDVLGDELALTHWLNRGDAARGIEPESYDRIVGGLYDPARRILLQRLLMSVEEERDALKQPSRDDGELAFLLATLARSPAAKKLRGERSVARQARFVGVMATRTGAAFLGPALDIYISSLRDAGTDDGTRFARLERMDGLAMRIESVLEPLDVLVLRDGRRQGSAVGYSYAVIYLGRFDQWVAAAPQSDVTFPVVAAELRQGHRFVELGPDGVRFLSLDQLLLGESLVVLRVPESVPEKGSDVDAAKDNAAARDVGTTVAATYTRLLDVIAQDTFINPPTRPPPDHSAALVEAVFGGPRLGLSVGSGHTPLFGRLIQTLLTPGSTAEVVLATLDGTLLSPTDGNELDKGEDVKRQVREELQEKAPVYLERR